VKRLLVRSLRYVLPIVIVAWLVIDIQRRDADTFSELLGQPKNYLLLFVAAILCLAGFCLSFVRWHRLVVALDLPFRLKDAFRLGFLGQMLGFVSLGSVGGDLFKAVFIAREQQSRRAEAAVSVFVDRAVGMYGMLILICIAVLTIGVQHFPPLVLRVVQTSLVGFSLGTIVLAAMLLGWMDLRWLHGRTCQIGWLHAVLLRCQSGIDHYSEKSSSLFAAVLMAVTSHLLIATSLYFAATALYQGAPTWIEHCVIWPVGGAASALPLTPAGLGTFEAALRYLYEHFSDVGIGGGIGLVVALCFRGVTVTAALIGFAVYWTDRRGFTDAAESAALDVDED